MWHPNDIIWSPKGHLISKWFLGVINFLQKNERTLLTWYLRSTCFRSFLEEIDVPRNHFKIIWPLDGQLKLTYWIVNFFRYLMTTGTFCSLPIGIPVTVSTMKNLVVNSFLSFVLSLFCSLKDGVISGGFFQFGHILKQMWEITSLRLSNLLNLPPLEDCNPFFHIGLRGKFYIT